MGTSANRRGNTLGVIAIRLSWATIIWAAASILMMDRPDVILPTGPFLLPLPLQIAVLASAPAALVGAILGVVYIALVARKKGPVLVGAAAVMLNVAYYIWFMSGL